MSAKDALNTFCSTSHREWQGTIYEIADARECAREYNGRLILAELKGGETVFTWLA